jgi:hypothetical protein
MQTAANKPFYRSRWWMPAVSVVIGLLAAVGGVAYVLAVVILRARS